MTGEIKRSSVRWVWGICALAFLISFCVSVAVGQAIFYVEGRHRLAVEPLLLVLAGQGLWWLRTRCGSFGLSRA